ncbi:ArgE/DapE family deacylase [Candidatus Bathyarchaeota archaeon]|nr:ArgE/DapE family deacylase [Candidatus Bathyarchaeota archaeon]
MSVEEKVLGHIDSRREEIISFMQKLIQTQSITGDESKIGALMAEECKRDGLEVDIVEPAENRVNVVAKYHGTGRGPRMMMYSHYDTLPGGDPDSWIHPAFSGEISDGFIWGRGACDNKLATCSLAMAFRALRELGVKLKGDIIFTHVGDEEKGGKFGFREILERGYGEDIDYLFYAHGGSGDTIGIAANGGMGLSVRVKGRSAHTAKLEEGINAVVKASHLINHLQRLADDVNRREYRLQGTDSVMRSRFSINKCVGFVATNNVPDLCEIYVDRRYTPGETPDQIEKEYRKVIDAAKREDPELSLDFQVMSGMLVSSAPADSELVKGIQKAAERVIGKRPKPVGGSHSSDHGWFVARYGKPFASYGIGGEGTHSSNERVKVEDVISTTKAYALSMLYLLGTE